MPTEPATGQLEPALAPPAASGPAALLMAAGTVLVAVVALGVGTLGSPVEGIVIALFPVMAVVLWPLLRLLPVTRMGWLYAATIVGVTIAPSLGALGSALRFGLAAAVGLCCLSVWLGKQRRGLHQAVPRSFGVLTVALIVVLLASALAAPSLVFGLTRLVNWVMFIPAAFLVAVRPDWRGLGAGVVVAALAQMAGVGLQLAGVIGGTWGGLLTSGTNYNPAAQNWLTRYTGLLLDPNNLAVILILAVLVCLSAAFGYRGRSRVPTVAALLALVVVFTFGILLSGSRGGLLCLVLAVAVFAVRMKGRALLLVGVAAIMAVMVAVTTEWSTVSLVVSSLGNIWDGTDASAGLRLGLWQSYLDQFDWVDYLTGRGFGGYFNGSLGDLSDAENNADVLRQATIDNAWLKMLLESGLFGCAIMLSLVIVTWRSAWGRLGSTKLQSAAVLGALSSLIFRSLSVDALDINPWNAIIWMTFGACLAIRAVSTHQEEPGGEMQAPLSHTHHAST